MEDLSGDGGVLKRVLQVAPAGAARPSSLLCVAEMRYEGRLSDGTVFDSCDDGTTFAFEVGQGKVIRAWDVAVASMAVGERAQLLCRADYAYGDAGAPPDIPPGATLTFDVELVSLRAPRGAGAPSDAGAELARLAAQREQRAAAAAAAAEERKSSAQKREEAKAAAAARLANKGQKKKGK